MILQGMYNYWMQYNTPGEGSPFRNNRADNFLVVYMNGLWE
jgi:hypothetical protein